MSKQLILIYAVSIIIIIFIVYKLCKKGLNLRELFYSTIEDACREHRRLEDTWDMDIIIPRVMNSLQLVLSKHPNKVSRMFRVINNPVVQNMIIRYIEDVIYPKIEAEIRERESQEETA